MKHSQGCRNIPIKLYLMPSIKSRLVLYLARSSLPTYQIRKGFSICWNQNRHLIKSLCICSVSEKTSCLVQAIFGQELHKGESAHQEWLLESLLQGSFYSSACCLFSATGFMFCTTDFNGYSGISEPMNYPKRLQFHVSEWKAKKELAVLAQS